MHKRRFIPAGAGNTGLYRHFISRMAVHPRGCGEHFRVHHGQNQVLGSSPRVRGTRPRVSKFTLSCRFIPAGAGNTAQGFQVYSLVSVHPRGCGEHFRVHHGQNQVLGSSPRVRGTLDSVVKL